MSRVLVTPDTMAAAVNSLSEPGRDSLRAAILPSQIGNSGKVLSTNGTTATWVPASSGPGGGSGTVTSVGVSGGSTGLTTSGGPVTTSGTITLGGTLSVANGGTGATNAISARVALNAQETLSSGTNIKTINGASILGSGNLTLSGSAAGLTSGSTSTGFVNYNGTIATAGQWHGASALPTGAIRLTYEGKLVSNTALIKDALNIVGTSYPGIAITTTEVVNSTSKYAIVNWDNTMNRVNIGAVGPSAYTSIVAGGVHLTANPVMDLRSDRIDSLKDFYANGKLTLASSLVAGGTAGTAGQVLTSTGTGVAWANAPAGTGSGGGSVTSVAISGGSTGLTVSGSPVTTAGTITLGGTLAVANGGTGASSAASARTNIGAQESLVSGTNIKTINGASILGSGNLTLSGSAAGLTSGSTSTGFVNYNGTTATAGQWHGGSAAYADSTTRITYNGRLVSRSMITEEMKIVRASGFATATFAASESPTIYGHITYQDDNNFLIGTVGTGTRITFTPLGTKVLSVNSTDVQIASHAPLMLGYETTQGASYKLQVNGQIFATSSTISTSDARYKTDVTAIDGALDIINALNPVSFNWGTHPVHEFPSGRMVGFIAQEVKKALSDTDFINAVVKTNRCELPDGTVEEFLGIAEGNLISILTAAVKELSVKNDYLEARLSAIEAKLL